MMRKERITDKEAICILIIFIFGSSLILSGAGEAKNDAWIVGIVGIIMAIPIILIFARILSLFKDKDLFDIINIVFGKIVGKVVSVLYIWYAFHLGALILRNFGEFANTIAMPETPMFVILFSLGVLCIVATRLGIEVVGRTCTYFLPLIFLIIIVVQLLAIPQIKLDYIKPILGNGFMPVLKSGFMVLAFPFAETVMLMGVFNSLKTKNSPFKVYFTALFISGVIITAITIRNIGVLGNMMDSYYFTSYEAVSMISLGSFIQRIELSVSFIFIFGVFIKSSLEKYLI
jgi:spore germination protein KB